MPQYSETLEKIIKSCLLKKRQDLPPDARCELALICIIRHSSTITIHDSSLKFTCTVQRSSKIEPIQSNIRKQRLSFTQTLSIFILISILMILISQYPHAIKLCVKYRYIVFPVNSKEIEGLFSSFFQYLVFKFLELSSNIRHSFISISELNQQPSEF
jgi:hypothetical protein